MKKITGTFLKGLFTLLPVLVSFYAVVWLLKLIESFAYSFMFWPDALYFPGMGVVIMIMIIFFFGIVVDRPFTRWIMASIEGSLSYVPLLKTVYLAIKDFTEFLKPSKNRANQVVVVKIPGLAIEFVGLLTRKDLRTMPNGISKDDRVAVYIPISYQLGGYTIFLPRSYVSPVDLTVEEAMRSIVTAWLPGSAEKLEIQVDENKIG